MINPVTQKSFIELCQQWAEVVNHGESGIQIWPPIGGAYLRIKQFLADTDLQNRLYSQKKPKFLLIDANEIADYSFKNFEKQVLQNLSVSKDMSLDSYLSINSQKLAIFLTGLDTAIKEGNRDILKYLGGLIQKKSHLSVILISELDMGEELLSQMAVKSPFLQNIFYMKLYRYEDSLQFFSYLEEKWKCVFDEQKTAVLAKKIGGHYWLLKESARILRSNPTFTVEEILHNPILVKKGLTLFTLLDKNVQTSVLNILTNKEYMHLDYLEEIGIVDGKTLKITYWYEIKKDLIEKFDSEQEGKVLTLDISFTALERDVFEFLLDSKDIVTREEIAKTLWQEQWEERYSDWAIDQLIHRLREKIELSHASYQIITKKGEGFVLISK